MKTNQFPAKFACPFFLYPNIEFYGYFKCGGLPLVRITMGDKSSANTYLHTWDTTEDFMAWFNKAYGKEVTSNESAK